MAKPTDSRVLWALALTGGCFTTLGLSMAGLLMYISAWVTSGGHPIGEPPNFVITFNGANEVGQSGAKTALLIAFAAGTAVIYFVSKHHLPSFLESTPTSSGLPKKGFLFGLLCGLASLISCASLMAIVGLVLESSKHSVSVGLLSFGLLAFPIMALYLLGVPVAFIGGIVGSITELLLRRIYRATDPPAATPDK
jgi:hypothetical protein